jgi:hypothetical protein
MEQSSKVSWRIRAISAPSGQTEVPFPETIIRYRHSGSIGFQTLRVDSAAGLRSAVPSKKAPPARGLRASGWTEGPFRWASQSAAAILFHQWNPRRATVQTPVTELPKILKFVRNRTNAIAFPENTGDFWKCQVRVPSTIAVKPTSAFASPSQPSMTRRARACSQWPGTSSPKPTRPNARASRRHQWRNSTPFRPAPTNAYGRSGTV